jgi:heavy metal sensor kinase
MSSKLRADFFSRLDVRLTITSTLILLFLATGLSIFSYFRLEHILGKQLDRILADETQELVDDIAESKDIITGCRVFEADISRRKYYMFSFRVLSKTGDVLYQSRKAAHIAFPESRHNRELSTLKMPDASGRYRLYERRIELSDMPDMYVQILTGTRQDRELLERFSDNLLLAFPVVLLLSVLCGMLAANRPRRIIKNIARITGSIGSSNLQERLPVPRAQDEVRELTLTINSMIERLEKSFIEIKQFTADVSHELRNPLFALKGTMEVALAEERATGEYREALTESLERVDVLIKMANDLFLISRFEMQKVNLDITSFNLGGILRDMYDFFLPMAQEKKLALSCEPCEDAVISGDKTRILQLINNLLDNAIKFTPEGGRVALMLARQGHEVHLEVRDSGIGIPESELPHIFKRFYQVDAARSGAGRGTGLGLQICKRIVDVHGGGISVEPNRDGGVTFRVVLPVQAKI